MSSRSDKPATTTAPAAPGNLLYGSRPPARPRPRRPRSTVPPAPPPQRDPSPRSAELRAWDLAEALNSEALSDLPPERIPVLAEEQFQLRVVAVDDTTAVDTRPLLRIYPSAGRSEKEGDLLVATLADGPDGYDVLTVVVDEDDL